MNRKTLLLTAVLVALPVGAATVALFPDRQGAVPAVPDPVPASEVFAREAIGSANAMKKTLLPLLSGLALATTVCFATAKTAPDRVPAINPTGNARLATAGTGDVLAGMVGAHLAAGASALRAASEAVYQHGQAADDWPARQALTASALARRVGGS